MADLHIHELSVRRHRVTCADATIIQHSMGHDAVTIELDEEWDGLSVVLAMTGQDGRTYEIIYTGEPIVIPASLTEEPGLLSVCVVGYGGDGKVRVLTAKASRLLRVEPSGPYEGDEPVPDSPDMLQQLTDAYERATDAAGEATKAAESANDSASAATSAADAATKAAKRADSSADAADKAAESANQAAAAAGEKVLYAYPDPEASDRIILQYPSFLESEDGGSVYLALEAAND